MSLGLTALSALKDSYSYSSVTILTDCQTLISTLSRGPARQPDSVCTSIWLHLSSISKIYSIHVQWIPAHVGIPGNTLADSKAKQGSTLPQVSVPVDLSTAKVLIRRTGQEEFHDRYMHDSHSATHRTLTGETSPQAHWRFGWSRSQCITVAQLRNGSLSTSGQLPLPYWTTTVSSVPTLRRRRRDGAASSTLLPVTRASTIIY